MGGPRQHVPSAIPIFYGASGRRESAAVRFWPANSQEGRPESHAATQSRHSASPTAAPCRSPFPKASTPHPLSSKLVPQIRRSNARQAVAACRALSARSRSPPHLRPLSAPASVIQRRRPPKITSHHQRLVCLTSCLSFRCWKYGSGEPVICTLILRNAILSRKPVLSTDRPLSFLSPPPTSTSLLGAYPAATAATATANVSFKPWCWPVPRRLTRLLDRFGRKAYPRVGTDRHTYGVGIL